MYLPNTYLLVLISQMEAATVLIVERRQRSHGLSKKVLGAPGRGQVAETTAVLGDLPNNKFESKINVDGIMN